MTEAIINFKNNCSLRLAQALTDKSDEEILRAYRAQGYVDNVGMRRAPIIRALEDLGLEIAAPTYPMTAQQRGMEIIPMNSSVANVRDAYPNGTYIVFTRNHVLALVDGILVDLNLGAAQTRAKVTSMCRVKNPLPKKEVEGRMVFNSYPKGRPGPTLRRRRDAYTYCTNYQLENGGNNPMASDVYENTLYEENDFFTDQKRGLASIV